MKKKKTSQAKKLDFEKFSFLRVITINSTLDLVHKRDSEYFPTIIQWKNIFLILVDFQVSLAKWALLL